MARITMLNRLLPKIFPKAISTAPIFNAVGDDDLGREVASAM
jgi:hypothetical protein